MSKKAKVSFLRSFSSYLWTNLTVHGNRRFTSPFACFERGGRAQYFLGTIAIICYSILYIHRHRSCSHRPGRVASVWWTIWCVVLPCARSSTAGISSIEWIMDKSSEHTAMALNLRVCISNEGRVMPWKFGAKLRNLQLLQYGYRFF